MEKGYVVNNTGRSRHIFKRTVYPGQKVDLQQVYDVLKRKVPSDSSFLDWLEGYLPSGWEVSVPEGAAISGGRLYKETLTAVPVVSDSSSLNAESELGGLKETNDGQSVVESIPVSWQYARPQDIDKMTAKDIYSLRMKDNPKRVIKNIFSIHKLRRALTLCKNDSRKAVLTRLIQGRIRKLNHTL